MEDAGAALPKFGHVPMILGADGERLSKRHGAVSVLQDRDDGFLPEALDNSPARLGWSHGDEEVFSMAQFVEWFDLGHVSRSPAQFNPEKLTWLNQHYIKASPDARLASLVQPLVEGMGLTVAGGPALAPAVALLKDRATTINHLAEAATLFYGVHAPDPALLAEHLGVPARAALRALEGRLAAIEQWDKAAISQAVKATLAATGLKMPQLAMPLRIAVTGRAQTPSIDAVLDLLGRDAVLQRLGRCLAPE